MGALLAGEWRKATELCGRALEILRDECVGTTWELNIAQNFFLGSLLFRGELRDYARDTLLAPSAKSRTYLRAEAVQLLFDAHQSGRANYGHRLWVLICFERWLQQLPSWTAAGQSRYHVTRSA